jgi:hypothetical protein
MGNAIQRTADQKNADIKANIVQIGQEVIAVAFQLICLSRIETTTDFMKPTLVLFLTLVVFTGPYLNTWLVFTENIMIKEFHDDRVMAFMILLAHVAGSLAACGFVIWWHPPSTRNSAVVIVWNKKQALTYNMTKVQAEEAMWEEAHWYVHFVEELFAVGSLLIGCAYLLWLRETRRAKPKPVYQKEKGIQIEMKFYLQLTLLVAAASQAFPSAALSVHILCFKLWMQTITGSEFFARLGGGVVGLALACLWCKAREGYRIHIQGKVSAGHEHHTIDGKQKASMQTTNYALLPPIRLAMQGASYF